MKIINYPGSICQDIYNVIHTCPDLFKWLWPMLFVSSVGFLVFSTFIKNDLLGEPGKKIRERYSWVVSESLFISTLLLSLFLLRIPNMILPMQDIDESEWILNAATFFHGAAAWKQVSGYTSGPLVFVPLNIMLLLGDGLNYTTERLFGILFCIMPCIYFIWKTVQKSQGETAARFAAIGMFLFFASARHYDVIAYNGEHVPLLLICSSIFLLYAWNGAPSPVKIALIGFLLGCIPYAKLQVVPVGLMVGLLAFIKIIRSEFVSPKKKLANACILLFSAILPFLFVSIYLTVHNCWGDFMRDYIQQNILFVGKGNIDGCHVNGFPKLLLPPRMLIGSISGLLLIIAYGLMVTAAFILTSTKPNKVFSNTFFWESASILFAAYSAIVIAGNNYPHYQLIVVFPSALFVGTLLGISFKEGSNPGTRAIYFCGIVLVLAACAVLKNPNRGIMYVKSNSGYPVDKVIPVLQKYSHPNDPMATWGYVEDIYVESSLTQANKFPDPHFAIVFPQKDNIYIDEYYRELVTNKPVIFMDAVYPTAFMLHKPEYVHENYPPISNYIQQNYTMVANVGGKRVYILNSQVNTTP